MQARFAAVIGTLCFCALPVLGYPAPSQDAPATARPGGAPSPLTEKRVIDGAKNPELIPDESAIVMWMRTLAIPLEATESQRSRFDNLTTAMKLSRNDAKILRSELGRLYPKVVASQNQMRSSRGQAAARSPMLEMRQACIDTWGRLLELMSADGRQRLRHGLDERKRHTQVVIETPPSR